MIDVAWGNPCDGQDGVTGGLGTDVVDLARARGARRPGRVESTPPKPGVSLAGYKPQIDRPANVSRAGFPAAPLAEQVYELRLDAIREQGRRVFPDALVAADVTALQRRVVELLHEAEILLLTVAQKMDAAVAPALRLVAPAHLEDEP